MCTNWKKVMDDHSKNNNTFYSYPNFSLVPFFFNLAKSHRLEVGGDWGVFSISLTISRLSLDYSFFFFFDLKDEN